MAPAEIEINRMRVCNSNKHQKTIIFTQVRNEHEQKKKELNKKSKKNLITAPTDDHHYIVSISL